MEGIVDDHPLLCVARRIVRVPEQWSTWATQLREDNTASKILGVTELRAFLNILHRGERLADGSCDFVLAALLFEASGTTCRRA